MTSIQIVREQFMLASTDDERIEFARKYIKLLPITITTPKYSNNTVKSELFATKLYEDGDSNFNDCLFHKAFTSYTQSLSVAPFDLLGLIFAKRSAVLQSMGKLVECLADIERADQFGYSDDSLHMTLKLRQAKCYKSLCPEIKTSQNFEQRVDTANVTRVTSDNTSKNSIKIYSYDESTIYPNIPSIGIKNKKTSCASEAVNIAHNHIFGKHFIATKNIEPGEILIVEKAYAAVLNQNCWRTHCSHCLRRSFNLQPCLNCAWAMFCSNECLQNAKKYHNTECEVVTEYLKICGSVIDTSELLTIRIIATIGIDSLLDMLSMESGINKVECNISTSSSSIFDLVSHDSFRSFDDMFEACCIAIDIVKCCKLVYNIGVINQLTGLILRTFLCRDSNAHGLIEQISDGKKITASKIGSGIFTISSLINHSCDPNVFRINYSNTLVHRASRFIEKGTQIMISYGVQFDKTSKVERQNYLSKYYFDCSCMACIDCWPLKEFLPKKPFFTIEEGDKEKIFFQLMCAKEKILTTQSPRVDQEIFEVNKNLLKFLYKNKKCLNQVYIEIEYEFKYFYRMLCTVKI